MIGISITGLIVLLLIIYLLIDFIGPRSILLRPEVTFGISSYRAKDLVVQEFDSKGNLWAARGLLVYSLKNGENKFRKVSRVPSGFTYFWLNNFTVIRRITLRPECIELTINDNGHLFAFSSGRMWQCSGNGVGFLESFKLPNFGLRVGRGIMSTGILWKNGHGLLFGEYFNNPERKEVRIYKYDYTDKHWGIVHEFQSGEIRHIHALQLDPYTGKLWICTGDEDSEAMIGWSDDGYRNINSIGRGSQTWRACQLVFTDEAVYWGADTGSEDLAGIYRWDKKSGELKRLLKTDGAIFFGTRLSNGNIVMSTDREGFPNEKDEITKLIIIDKDDQINTIPCGTWKYTKPGFRFNFAKLRFQRNQGSSSLVISVLNQKEYPDGDLILIDGENFLNKI
jgi:hypothetical protein